MGLIALGVGYAIWNNDKHPQPASHHVPKVQYLIPPKCMKQAMDITQGQVDAELPMMAAEQLEQLANRCGGKVIKEKVN